MADEEEPARSPGICTQVCQIVCSLLYLYCASGCKASTVASAMAFHPPHPPFYDMLEIPASQLEEEDEKGREEVEGSGDNRLKSFFTSSPGRRSSRGSNGKQSISNLDVIYTTDSTGEVTYVMSEKTGNNRDLNKSVFKIVLCDMLPTVPSYLSGKVSGHMVTVPGSNTMVPLVVMRHPEAYFTVIVSHGNAADVGSMFTFYWMLFQACKVNVVGYDYSGYGTSKDTRPTEDQTYLDIEAVYDFVVSYKNGILIGNRPFKGKVAHQNQHQQNNSEEIRQLASERIILYGQSVGSGPSLYIAGNESYKYIEDSNCCVGASVTSANETTSIELQIRQVEGTAGDVYKPAEEDDDRSDTKSSLASDDGSDGENHHVVVKETGCCNAAQDSAGSSSDDCSSSGGCDVLCQCCSDGYYRSVAGVILHSPFMSGLRVLTSNRCLCGCDIYPNIDRVCNVSSPVFVIHGDRDMEVPVNHGMSLQDRVPFQYRTEPYYVPNKGHNDILMGNEDVFFQKLNKYFDTVSRRQRSDGKGKASTTTNSNGSGNTYATGAQDMQTLDKGVTAGLIVERERNYKNIAMSMASIGNGL